MTQSFGFSELDGVITTHGTNFSGRVTVLARSKQFRVWRVEPGHVYSGLGRPFNRTSSKLFLIKIEDGLAKIVERCEPGRFWRKKRSEFIEKMLELSGADWPESMAAFQREG